MGSFIIEGSNKLEGIVKISGSKNSALPIIAGTVLKGREYIISNVPDIEDVRMMLEILMEMGCSVCFDNGEVHIDTRGLCTHIVPENLVKRIRSSIILMGAVLGRTGSVEIAFPGGCEIGLRPIDLHLKGLKRLGADISEKSGILCAKVKDGAGCDILLDYPSVGATENIMLFASVLPGLTTVNNAAREPEIIDLQNFLNECGYKVSGAGTGTIIIDGNNCVKDENVSYEIISDRIEAGTYLSVASVTNSRICLKNIEKSYFSSIMSLYEDAGCIVSERDGDLEISRNHRLDAVDKVTTQPYPGFPTDMQAQLMASMASARGTTIIRETVFESRFKHVPELNRMGADITAVGRTAIINGVERLHGAEVDAHDLRGGAALVVAAIGAEGITRVNNIYHIDRGYEKFTEKLQNIGVNIYMAD